MPNPTLIKNFIAEAAVSPYRIVKIGAADGQVLQGAANSDALFAVADMLGQATVNGQSTARCTAPPMSSTAAPWRAAIS